MSKRRLMGNELHVADARSCKFAFVSAKPMSAISASAVGPWPAKYRDISSDNSDHKEHESTIINGAEDSCEKRVAAVVRIVTTGGSVYSAVFVRVPVNARITSTLLELQGSGYLRSVVTTCDKERKCSCLASILNLGSAVENIYRVLCCKVFGGLATCSFPVERVEMKKEKVFTAPTPSFRCCGRNCCEAEACVL
ncbi:hypothetical protein K0M31_015884 [Melipona bicolor]|uniref:Uncharacterized protein n=1 Tax=Melipona bicolor TaxID=60889 RepID=A0AA40G6C7_9HYME|nr:hypothetical protein K0M31_015884 [Melipona bicolor]